MEKDPRGLSSNASRGAVEKLSQDQLDELQKQVGPSAHDKHITAGLWAHGDRHHRSQHRHRYRGALSRIGSGRGTVGGRQILAWTGARQGAQRVTVKTIHTRESGTLPPLHSLCFGAPTTQVQTRATTRTARVAAQCGIQELGALSKRMSLQCTTMSHSRV